MYESISSPRDSARKLAMQTISCPCATHSIKLKIESLPPETRPTIFIFEQLLKLLMFYNNNQLNLETNISLLAIMYIRTSSSDALGLTIWKFKTSSSSGLIILPGFMLYS